MYSHLRGVVQMNHYLWVDVVQIQFLRVQSYFMAVIPWYDWPKILRNCSFDSYAYKCTSFAVFYRWFCSICCILWRIPLFCLVIWVFFWGMLTTCAK